MPTNAPRSVAATLPPGLAARVAALASGGVALMLAGVARDAHSVTGQVLLGSFLALVLASAWLLWFRDVFMVRAVAVAVMAAVAVGGLLAGTVGLPGRGEGDFSPFDVVLVVLSLAICTVLGLDAWLRDRSAR